MPRRLRVHVPGGFYHVTLRGNHQRDIFIVDSDRHLLNTIVARALEKYGAQLHAYCWMKNHLHLLMRVDTEPLGSPMRQIAAEFARAMQRKLSTTGHYFERRYHAKLVVFDAYLMQLVRYIHLNPVRACVVADAVDFPWSSHHVYIGARDEPWVCTDFVLRMFGTERAKAVAAYLDFISSPGDDAVLAETPPVEATLPADDENTVDNQRPRASARSRQTLLELIAEACQRFEVSRDDLESQLRDAYLVKVRAWIAFQATKRRVATLAAVARELHRDEATLRYAMRAYPQEME